MATKRTSFLKRQKELKRIEKANQKREDRMQRRLEKSDEYANPSDTDSNLEKPDENNNPSDTNPREDTTE